MENPLKELFGNIASEIKKKTGDPDFVKYKPVEFPTKIRSISQGGSTAEIDSILDEINGEVVGELVVAEGSCGGYANYLLNDSGVLKITGTGEIITTPWSEHKDDIFSIVIGDGITTLPLYAFRSCAVASVDLGNTLSKIGPFAFTGCNSLQSISIPASVQEIGLAAFSSCKTLKQIRIMDASTWNVYDETNTFVATYYPTDLASPATVCTLFTETHNTCKWVKV